MIQFGKLAASALLIFCLLLPAEFVWARDTSPHARAHCRNNGSCCEKLKKFWADHTAAWEDRTTEEPQTSVIEVFSSSAFPFTERMECPNYQSMVAEALVFLRDISLSDYARFNYFEWVVQALGKSGYSLSVTELPNKFAATNHDVIIIELSGSLMFRSSPVLLASQIVHESVHVDRNSPHVNCSHGQLKGNRNCDEVIDFSLSEEAMSYSFQLAFLHDSVNMPLARDERIEIKDLIYTIIKNQINSPPEYGPDGVTPIKKYYGVEHRDD